MTSPARIFNCFSNQSTVVARWNSAIRSAIHNGSDQEALLLFRQMKQSRVQPDNLTFPFVAKACSRLSILQYSQIVHAHVVKSLFSDDIFVQTTMVDAYVKCGCLGFAEKLFEEMPERDVATWNVIINGLAQEGLLGRISVVFRNMRLEEIKPDSLTIISMIQASSYANNMYAVKSVHCLGILMGLEAYVSVANTLVASYPKCNDLLSAESLFSRISEVTRTVVSWNSMISGCSYLERAPEALYYFCQLCQANVRPDLSTFLSLISSCTNSRVLLQGKLTHCYVIKIGFGSNVLVTNSLISMYCKCGDIACSRHLFDNMRERTHVSWTAMISGYAQEGNIDKALKLFEAMEIASNKPDEVAVATLLSGCSYSGALDVGRWLNSYVHKRGFGENVMVCNALIDMYAKCGSLFDARKTFDSMNVKTVVTWTTIIAGYAMNGNSEEALALFLQMVNHGVCPNKLTFLALLQACTHAGLLEEGWKYFNLMEDVYSISPELEHHSCMVDLLGRKAKEKEALDFIQNMPVKPDQGIWGSLLGACKLHQNVEIGEFAANRLFDLEPNNAASYVVMANIYAGEDRWEGVAKIRSMMRSKALRKAPGQSIVRVDGKVHIFSVEDRSHPEGLVLYEVLDCLALQIESSVESCHWE